MRQRLLTFLEARATTVAQGGFHVLMRVREDRHGYYTGGSEALRLLQRQSRSE